MGRSWVIRGAIGVALAPALGKAAPAGPPTPPAVEWNDPAETEGRDDAGALRPYDEELSRLRGSELKREIPDLEVRRWPPPLRLSLVFGGHFPLQVIGVGAEVEWFAVDWLRLSAAYMVGLSDGRSRDVAVSSYAEGLIGVRVLGLDTERDVDVRAEDDVIPARRTKDGVVPLERRDREADPKQVVLKAALPAHHALFVEGGAFTGLLSTWRCVARCDPFPGDGEIESEERQLVFAVAGLRYVYYVHAASDSRRGISRRMQWQAFAHVIREPWNDWKPGTYWSNDFDVKRSAFGWRAGIKIPTCTSGRCPPFTAVVGYLPMPGTVLFEFGVGG
jgi:hypothetical protein